MQLCSDAEAECKFAYASAISILPYCRPFASPGYVFDTVTIRTCTIANVVLLCTHVLNQARYGNHAFTVYTLVEIDLCKPTACLLSQTTLLISPMTLISRPPYRADMACSTYVLMRPVSCTRASNFGALLLRARSCSSCLACSSRASLQVISTQHCRLAINAVQNEHSLHCGTLPFTAIAGGLLFSEFTKTLKPYW